MFRVPSSHLEQKLLLPECLGITNTLCSLVIDRIQSLQSIHLSFFPFKYYTYIYSLPLLYPLALTDIAFLMSALSLLTAVGYCFLDKYAKRKVKFEPIREIGEREEHCVNPRTLNIHYWLWVLIGVTIYSTIFPFLALSRYVCLFLILQ